MKVKEEVLEKLNLLKALQCVLDQKSENNISLKIKSQLKEVVDYCIRFAQTANYENINGILQIVGSIANKIDDLIGERTSKKTNLPFSAFNYDFQKLLEDTAIEEEVMVALNGGKFKIYEEEVHTDFQTAWDFLENEDQELVLHKTIFKK